MATPTSGQQAAKQNGTAKTGGKRRHVASAAGVKRYGKPIGSEIGGPRDANHAAIQQDQGARKNYGDLIGGDQAAQRKTLDGMSTEDLNKLADISFSFKSSDPKVVALRIAARNAQARRGIRVKPGQTQTNPGKPAPSVNRSNRGAVKALSGMPNSARLIELANAAKERSQHATREGSFPIPDVAHLRKAIQAIGRAKPEQRPMVARHIIARAKALKATHLVSDHIAHYAKGGKQPGTIGMSQAEADAIELAGRWKHGYIPLDAVALESKMKGRTGGKKWWGDGTHGGVSGNLKPHGSPKSGSPGGSSKLTKVVKSGAADSKPRGAAVNDTYTRGHAGAKDGFDRGHRVSYTLNGKKRTGTITRIENGSGATVRRNRGEGAHDLVDRKNLTHVDTPEKQAHNAYLAADKGSPEKTKYAAETKKHFDARAREDIAKGQARLKTLGIDTHGNRTADEQKIADRIASGKARTTQGLLSKSQEQQIRSLRSQGKTEEAASLTAKSLADSKARIAKMVAAKKGAGGPGKA